MTSKIFAVVAAVMLATPVFAAGDAAKGEKDFNRCKSCHAITAEDGTNIVRGGRTGPNLYGVIGRTAGTVDGFRYGKDLVAAGEAGLVWDEATFEAYVQDPRGFLVDYLDSNKARSKMAFKLKSGAEDVYAYLLSVSDAQ